MWLSFGNYGSVLMTPEKTITVEEGSECENSLGSRYLFLCFFYVNFIYQFFRLYLFKVFFASIEERQNNH